VEPFGHDAARREQRREQVRGEQAGHGADGAATANTRPTSAVTIERTCAGVAPTARRSAYCSVRRRSAAANVEATTSATTRTAVPANEPATVVSIGASARRPLSMSTPFAARSAAAATTTRKLPAKLAGLARTSERQKDH